VAVFSPAHVTWPEQLRIESHGSNYLPNVVRIMIETGLRIYKELLPVRKEDVDFGQRSRLDTRLKDPNGIAEVP
jgi:integrase